MDISQKIAELKTQPGFQEQVGMILVHNGVVRGSSRQDGRKVESVQVWPDQDKIRNIQEESNRLPGIFQVLIQAREGHFQPGEDLLYIIVAGDIRENVKHALSQTLEEVKTRAISKQEVLVD
ncbi:MAG: molybdenum cofactor biosynthesis protein MoaE [Desulfohalobiaceae bacterium]